MKEETIKHLYKKYKLGETSLEEEKKLFENVQNLDLSFYNLSTFIKKNKKEPPSNLNSKLWDSFEKKQKKKTRLKVSYFSGIAASLFLMLILYQNQSKKNNYKQKEALLNEVKNMFENKTTYHLIIENDLVSIYAKE